MIRLLGLLLLLIPLLGNPARAAELVASVDRLQVMAGDSVELTLELSAPALANKPDLTPLLPLFEVLDSRQINRVVRDAEGSRATTRWILTLLPRRTGYVVIPPLQVGDAVSAPITLQVSEASAPESNGERLMPVFIDASLDRDTLYVQAQALLTLRIYHSVSLFDDSTLTPLQTPEARVEQLGKPRTYETRINGVRHGVIEVRYAVHPLRSGELELPSQVFSATLVERSDPGAFNPFGPRSGRRVQVSSPTIPLTVKPVPAEYPADAPWLPATALTLSESWSDSEEPLKVGDSLTRTLILRAEGLSASQLPPVPLSEAEGVRRYPDQPKLESSFTETGLRGLREQREALVATRPGTLEIPATELVWWNLTTDSLERVSLPARRFEVQADPQLVSVPPAAAGETEERLLPWQLSTLVLGLTTLLGFTLWWRARRQPAVPRTLPTPTNTRSLLDELKRACQANDPQATRQALDAWARAQPETLADMAARSVPLSAALDGLNGVLYGVSGQQWDGRELWLAIRDLPPRPDAAPAGNGALPPLYPR